MTENQKPIQVVRSTQQSARNRLRGAFLYVNTTGLTTKRMVYSGLFFTVVGVILVMIFGGPKIEQKSNTGMLEIPFLGGGDQKVELPDKYNRAKEALQYDFNRKNAAVHFYPKEKLLGPKLIARPKNLKIPPGVMTKATLMTGASNGTVKAMINDPVEVAGEVLVEAGSVLIGLGSSTEDRLFVHFNKLVDRDGQVNSVQADAADASDKVTGLKGSRLSAEAIKLGLGIGLNFLGSASEALQETRGEQGVLVRTPSIKNALLQGSAKASIDQSKELMNSARNSKPVLVVESGTVIYLIFTGVGDQQ